jgi:hypothetical protein
MTILKWGAVTRAASFTWSTLFGLHQTAGVYSGALAVLAAAAAGSFVLHRRPSREQFSAKEKRA